MLRVKAGLKRGALCFFGTLFLLLSCNFSVAASGLPRTTPELPALKPVKLARGIGTAAAGTSPNITLVRKAKVTGRTGYVLFDLATGKVLDSHNPQRTFIPASVAKVPTALFALSMLGPEKTFRTRLAVDGAIQNGVLYGNLYLIGSGDPTLDTADLGMLAQTLKQKGITRINGSFFYDDAALPDMSAIDQGQPVYAAYNPGISGLNLNYNRVLIKWSRKSRNTYAITQAAHARDRSVQAETVRVSLDASANAKAFRHGVKGGREVWKLRQRMLGKKGSRWLPVRESGRYTAEVFRSLAAEIGVSLPASRRGLVPPSALHLATLESEPLQGILTGMLKHSTNLTAEVLLAKAAQMRGADLESTTAGEELSRWMRVFVPNMPQTEYLALRNGSGLSTSSRMTPQQMALILQAGYRKYGDGFIELLDDRPHGRYGLHFQKGSNPPRHSIYAKTGTVYYGRGLAGYLNLENGRKLGFVIFSSDIPRRKAFDARLDPESTYVPKGSGTWLANARKLERAILRQWVVRYGR